MMDFSTLSFRTLVHFPASYTLWQALSEDIHIAKQTNTGALLTSASIKHQFLSFWSSLTRMKIVMYDCMIQRKISVVKFN